MLSSAEREAIAEMWSEKLTQDARGLPSAERHRNLEPASAEFICALAGGCGFRRLLEIGGSSGLSTIALAAAARHTDGRVVSIEIETTRQESARQRLRGLGLARYVDLLSTDAGQALGECLDLEFVLIDGEKDDCEGFLGLLRLSAGAVDVADNILSHELEEYVEAVRAYPDVESMTLPIGKGLEVAGLPADRRGAGRAGAVGLGDEADERRPEGRRSAARRAAVCHTRRNRE